MFASIKSLFTETKSAGMSLADPGAASLFFGYGPTASGADISPETALRVPAVFASVKVISESISQLPVVLYRHLADGGKEPATDHPLFDILGAAPNSFTTSVEFRLSMQSALCAYGNAYAWIGRDGAGAVRELIFLHPLQVAVEVDLMTQEPLYRVTELAGNQNIYSRAEIFHLRTFGAGQLSGYVGISPLVACREAIGLAMALEEHGARLFSNGARPAGVFKYGKALTQPVLDRLRSQLAGNHEGARNAGKTLILEDNMSWESLQYNSVDSQYIELRHFAIQEIARAFRLAPHMIGDLSRSTNNNIEQQAKEFVAFSLLPIIKNWEATIAHSLMTAEERREYFVQFDLDDLTRADIDKRFAAYAVAVNNGLLNPNEVRAKENLPAYEGGGVFTRPLNGAPTAPAAPPADDIHVWGA